MDGAWDAGAVRAPSVVRTEDGYVMFYSGYNAQGGMIGMVNSPDGVTWTEYDDTDVIHWRRSVDAVLEFGDVPVGRAIWFTELLRQDETYYIFFKLGTGDETEVFLATYAGPLPVPVDE